MVCFFNAKPKVDPSPIGSEIGIWASGGIWEVLEASGLEKLNTSQLKCKSSLKMSILRFVFDSDINFDM